MNTKNQLIIGAISTIVYAITLVPTFQRSYIQGSLLIVFSLSILTIIWVSWYKRLTNITNNVCESLCRILYEILSYSFLFNAFCILISHDSLWMVTIFQGIFFPIILSSFIGHNTHRKSYRYCSTIALTVSVASCSFSCDMRTMILLAIFSNIVCMIMPISRAITLFRFDHKNVNNGI